MGQFRSLSELVNDLKLVKGIKLDEKDKLKIEEVFQ